MVNNKFSPQITVEVLTCAIDQGQEENLFISQLFVISPKLAKLSLSELYLISYSSSLAQNSSSNMSLDLLSGTRQLLPSSNAD